jgi:anti-sigma factor RsiW
MRTFTCLWYRSRLAPFADGALDDRRAHGVTRHVAACAVCRGRVEDLRSLRAAVRSAAAEAPEPDWTDFWTGVERRLRVEVGRAMRESWWRAYWKPIWGHPRAALATGAITVILIAAPFWPGADRELPLASAASVIVQDVAAEDPDGTVMVYADPERGPGDGITVIWLFASARN